MVNPDGSGDDDDDDDERELRASVAAVGIQLYLKMLVWDNLIHADLHPGNVIIRMEDIGPLARLQRYLAIGDSSSRVAHVVLLDAGLAANFKESIYGNVRKFFESIARNDHVEYGHSILGLAGATVAPPAATSQ